MMEGLSTVLPLRDKEASFTSTIVGFQYSETSFGGSIRCSTCVGPHRRKVLSTEAFSSPLFCSRRLYTPPPDHPASYTVLPVSTDSGRCALPEREQLGNVASPVSGIIHRAKYSSDRVVSDATHYHTIPLPHYRTTCCALFPVTSY